MTTFELSKEYIEKLELAIRQKDEIRLKAEMEELYSADIASILFELDGEEAHYLMTLLDIETGAEILSHIEADDRKRFIRERFTIDEIAKYVNLFDSDDAVDLLNEQTIEVREKVIALLEDREQARFIIDLMHYPEDVAGGLMQKELIKVNTNWTVSECVEEIRRQAEDVERVYAVYVVDDEQRLKGIVSLKKIVLARKNTKIENILDEEIAFVETTRSAEEVAEIMQRYDLDAIPVVNTLGRLLGRITIDDVVDFITDKAEEDIQVMAGITGEAEEDDSVWQLSKARLPWLVVGVIGSLLAATVIKNFEGEFQKMAALAAFIPIMGSTGGNVGIQTSSLIVQSLAEKSGITTSLAQRLFKIILVALVNGLVIGTLAGIYVYVIGETQLFLVVCLSLLSVVILASFTGTVTPLLLDRFGINPAIASGPFITTANDIIGIGTYLMIANFFITSLEKMIAVIQRVSQASVTIDGEIKSAIETGFLILLGITHTDNEEDIEWLSKKIIGLRVFSDADGKINLDISQVNGNILLISQFTLHASTKKGNRPSFIEAARPEIAIPLYEKMIAQLNFDLGKPIGTGTFGADMKVLLMNDGPVTIIIDSKNRI